MRPSAEMGRHRIAHQVRHQELDRLRAKLTDELKRFTGRPYGEFVPGGLGEGLPHVAEVLLRLGELAAELNGDAKSGSVLTLGEGAHLGYLSANLAAEGFYHAGRGGAGAVFARFAAAMVLRGEPVGPFEFFAEDDAAFARNPNREITPLVDRYCHRLSSRTGGMCQLRTHYRKRQQGATHWQKGDWQSRAKATGTHPARRWQKPLWFSSGMHKSGCIFTAYNCA